VSSLRRAYTHLFQVAYDWGPIRQGEHCRCEEGADCWHFPGYVWCRACEEHHRQECVINELGQGLDPFGEPWPDQA